MVRLSSHSTSRGNLRARVVRDETGAITLVELLVATGILLAIFGVVIGLLPGAFSIATRSQERTFTVLEARTAIEQIGRDLRTATAIGQPTSQKLSYDTPTRSVTIECTNGGGHGGSGQGQGEGVCNRRTAPLGQNPANSPATAIASRVTNTDVFGVSPGPASGRDYVCIKVIMSVDGSDAPVTIQNAVAIRNNPVSTTSTVPCGAA